MAVGPADLAHELDELVAALDRRVPRVERAGEASIAREAAALREKAVKRLAELRPRGWRHIRPIRTLPPKEGAPGRRCSDGRHPLERRMDVIIVGRDPQGGDEGFLPYRHLAMHVLARALLDLSNAAGSATDRESARLFLSGSPMLFHWCRVAALDPRLVSRHAARLAAVG